MQGQIAALITPVMAGMFVMVFALLWRGGKAGSHVLAFAGSYGCVGLGLLAGELLPVQSLANILLTHVLFSACLVLGSIGLCLRVGRQPPLKTLLFLYGISAGFILSCALMDFAVAPQIMIRDLSFGLMTTVTVSTLMTSYRREVTDKLLIGLQITIAANFFLRPIAAVIVGQDYSGSGFRDSLFASIGSLATSTITLSSAIILVGVCILDQFREIREQAELDLLTGLRTRRAFEQGVIAQIEKAKDLGAKVTLIVADIDHFKAVNDVWGHQTGDNAIAMVGGVIEGTIRRTDLAGRIGGEEFCILAWECDGDAGEKLAERIRLAIQRCPVPGIPDNHHLTASFGIAERMEGEGYGRLFARCDAALYEAKEGGRNRSVSSRKARFGSIPSIGPTLPERRRVAG